MRLISWNVNGLRAVAGKDLLPWKQMPDADVLALQETKCHPDMLEPELSMPMGYHSYWCSAQKSGYSGVALICKQKPEAIIEGLGDDRFDCEGRVIAARFAYEHAPQKKLLVISAYFPNSQEGGKRIDYKIAFCTAMEKFLAAAQKRGEETLLLGDYNIAPHAIDLARPKDNEKSPGYLPEERAWMARYLGLGYHDVWRERNPGVPSYSWWSMRTGARARNIGWRIDMGTTTPGLLPLVTGAAIHPDIMGSDHCPVSIDLR